MSEWLRSEIANLMLSECVSSNLTAVDKLFRKQTREVPRKLFLSNILSNHRLMILNQRYYSVRILH